MADDTAKTLIGVSVAFGLAVFLLIIALATNSMLGTASQTNTTAVEDSVSSFLKNFAGIATIVLLISVVLGKLGVSNIIERVFT